MLIRRWFYLSLLLAALLVPLRPSLAGEPLAARIETVTQAAEFKHAHWGILVVDLASGETLYEQNPDKLFAPASVTKLFSVAAALAALGPDHRFRTPVYALGDRDSEGTLHGDLVLVASGDLTMGGRTDEQGRIAFCNVDHTYANGPNPAELTPQNPLAGLEELARQVSQAGIRRIKGDVLVDDRLFDKCESTGSGPQTVTPMIVNDNLIDVQIAPAEPGEPANISWRPRTAVFNVDGQVDTVAAGQPLRITLTAPAAGALIVRGQIPADHQPIVRVHEVPDATSFARSLFIEALQRAGVKVDASPLTPQTSSKLPEAAVLANTQPLSELLSPPFSENVRLILKVSHNLHASTLPLLVAGKHGERTLQAGLRRQAEFLKQATLEVDTISFGGGAGGSRADFVTPRATVQLLRYMATRDDAAVYRAALPILGVDGTLATSVPGDSPAKGHAQAKTGTFFWENTLNNRYLLTSKALAGYATTCEGRELAFAMFVNHVHLEKAAETTRIGQVLGKLCEVIYHEQAAQPSR